MSEQTEQWSVKAAPPFDGEADKPAEETFTWMVLKRDPRADEAFIGPVWVEVGEIVSESAWSAWQWNGEQEALAEIARLGMDGGGDYLLLHAERCIRVSVVAETVYRRAEQS